MVDEWVAAKPWKVTLADPNSGMSIMVKMGPQAFQGKLKSLVTIANELKLSTLTAIESFITLPLINGNI